MRFDKILSKERVIPVSNEFPRRSDNGKKMHLEKVEKVLRDLDTSGPHTWNPRRTLSRTIRRDLVGTIEIFWRHE